MLMEMEQLAALQLEHLGDKLRGEGRLGEAAIAYARLLRLKPDHLKAERLVSNLSGHAGQLHSTSGGLKAAPFAEVPNFLPPSVRDAVHSFLVSKADTFDLARTNSGKGS